jgi:hypothetical protein
MFGWGACQPHAIDGGACINIMPNIMFEKLGHDENELIKTNMMLNGFSGEASEAKASYLRS